MKLLFIISGSIAVKKCSEILAILKQKQIITNCIITESAKKMIDLKKLKNNINGKVYYDDSEKNNLMLHIKLTRDSNLIVVCPATENIIAKYANGYANDLATNSLIASNKQIIFFPAMNTEMWNNPINQDNVKKLKNFGVEFFGPEHGILACGETGLGRLSNINSIVEVIILNLTKSEILKNKKCLITAGPTIENIDPIRYISNHSSGKQGYAIAKQMMLSGAKVILISGPTNLQAPSNVKLVNVKTSNEMYNEVKKNAKVDIAIFAAAVTDASPKKTFISKIKKKKYKNIILKENVDIIKKISSKKNHRPKIVVGFAAETNNLIDNAKKKLIEKNCDILIANKIDKKNKVFGSDFNKVSIITKKKIFNLKKMSKIKVAKELINYLSDYN